MRACGETRVDNEGTWVSEELIKVYKELFNRGKVLSVEVWDKDNELVGGLYGVVHGKIYFGESMFFTKANASKFGLISLCRKLEKEGFIFIDCQQETPHLMHMGAKVISAAEFWNALKENWLHILDQPRNGGEISWLKK
jgi:leucyl/phenylalanyl-tRNA--protein transferase